METRNLGCSGLKVSALCLGTMTFNNKNERSKNSWGMTTIPMNECHALLDEFVAQGGNFIDTADAYGPCEAEECIGEWLAKRSSSDRDFRKKIVIATKVFNSMGPSPNNRGLSRVHIMDAVDASLKRLKTSYIDLYQCHAWDESTPLEETMEALNDLVKAGKIHYIGISNYNGWQTEKAIMICKMHNYAHVITCQMLYNLLDRNIECEFVGIRKHDHVDILAWSPLGGGWLSGKIKRGDKPQEGSRVDWATQSGFKITDMSHAQSDRTWNILEALEKIAKSHNSNVAAISLSWLLAKGCIPILGASNMTQLKDNMMSHTLKLSSEEIEMLEKASYCDKPYPYSFL